jgi:hypothetical protein
VLHGALYSGSSFDSLNGRTSSKEMEEHQQHPKVAIFFEEKKRRLF